MLFVMSPFALGRHSLHQQIGSIPFLGAVYSLILNPKLDDPLLKPTSACPKVDSLKKDGTVAHET